MRFPRKLVLLSVLMLLQSTLTAQIKLIKETNLTRSTSDDRYASYTPDGRTILFESNRDGNWNIYLMDADGSNVKKLSKGKSNNRRARWHPNGKMILFESDRSGKFELYTLHLEHMQVNQLTTFDAAQPLFGDYAPDGETIAISLKESDDKSNIVIINMKGEIIKRLTNAPYRSYFPRWSKDGKEILYFSRKETDNQDDEIYSLHLETGVEKRLTNWPKHNFCPSWSNDGSKIVYVKSMDNIRPEIYIMDADGLNQIRITHNEDGDTLPDWSPTGNKILITGYRNGNFEICELELDTSRK